MKARIWEKMGDRSYLPFSISFNGAQNATKYLKAYADFKSMDACLYAQNAIYWLKGDRKIIADYQIKKYNESGTSFLWDMAAKCEKAGNIFIEDIRRLSLEKCRNKSELLSNFKIICEEFRKFVVFMTIPWVLESFFDEMLDKILSKRDLTTAEKNEFAKRLNQPLKFNEGQLELISLLNIAVSSSKINSAAKAKSIALIEDHIKKYSWISMRWLIGEPLSHDEVELRLTEIKKNNPAEKLEEFKLQLKKIKTDTISIAKRLKFSAEELDEIYLLKEYVYIRTYRSDIINKCFGMIMPRLNQIAAKLGLRYDDLLYLTYLEIIECMQDKSKLKSVHIPDRKKAFALLRIGEDFRIYEGDEAIKLAESEGITSLNLGRVKELKGSIGYSGIVQGRVAIVHNPNDCKKVKKGDILVAVMTFPSYIIAMERAAAFVTDEGGVLCHAAIVAREMKKPCIIATKTATAVLKDGDLIEVDAIKGIVRKI